MNALTILIQKHLKLNETTRNALATKMGYTNVTKGLRAVDKYLDTLEDKGDIRAKLQQALDIPQEEFDRAIELIRTTAEQEARESFKPQIQVIPSSKPEPLFVAGLVPHLLSVDIPAGCTNLEFDEEIEAIWNAYKRHQLENNVDLSEGAENDFEAYVKAIESLDSKGEKYNWSVGKGFRYFRNYDECLVFDKNCNLVEHIRTHEDKPVYDRSTTSLA